MANRHGKEVDDREYHSQPVMKSSSWVLQKFRRPKNHAGPSSFVPENPLKVALENPSEDTPENHHRFSRKWAIENEESKNWSKDVVEFYNNGDAPFCYSLFFKLNKLDRDFWGTLLGYQCNGRLSPLHIEGWVTRMMRVRWTMFRKNGPSGLRWTILPPQFRVDLCSEDSKITAKWANGTTEPFPPFWEVDYVYIPLYIQRIDEWLLVRINMHTMEMLQYWSNNRFAKEGRKLVHLPVLDSMPIFFGWLMEEIHYWRRYTGPYDGIKYISHAATGEYLPKDGGELGGDSGVLVCMLMEKLVKGECVSMEGDFKDTCLRYRRKMADQFYWYRFLPASCDG